MLRVHTERVLLLMKEEIKKIIAKQLRIDASKISDSSNLLDDLGVDSLEMIEVVMAIEERFGLSVPDEDLVKLKTVDDAVAYIKSKKPDAV